MSVLKFFREETDSVVGAYFDGEKIFIVRWTGKFETVEVEAGGSDFTQLAEQIAQVCKQKGWETTAVGFCLRAEEAVTFQTEVGNVPAKEVPALVKSWATAQAGRDAVFSSVAVGEELWLETLPRAKVEEICAAFKRFGLNLRGLSVMPADALTKLQPFEQTEFITAVVRDRKAPNLLSQGSVWSWKRISFVTAAVFVIGLIIGSVKVYLDCREATDGLDAAKTTLDEIRDDVTLKQALDADIAELHRLNRLAAQVDVPNNFNVLISLGKLADRSIHLTKIQVDDKTLELEGLADKPADVRNYLASVKRVVSPSARLERSEEQDDGNIAFVIRAPL